MGEGRRIGGRERKGFFYFIFFLTTVLGGRPSRERERRYGVSEKRETKIRENEIVRTYAVSHNAN